MKDKKKLQAFIFDMDGTLFDTEKIYGEVWKAVGLEQGFIITDEMLDRMRGASMQRGAEIFEEVNPGFDYYEVRKRRVELVYAHIEREGVPKKPGLDKLFAYLHAHGYRIAIGTSTHSEQAQHYLRSVDMLKDFDFIGTGELVSRGKPAPDLFLLCAEKMGVSPESCCVVEDSVNGILGGHAAGGFVIGIEDQQDISETRAVCDVQLERLDQIIEWLEA